MLDERDRSLFSAVISVAAGLELHATLRRITQAAADLVHARYAALGVPGPRGIEQFIHVGMDEVVVAGMEHPPVGRGILGLLISDPVPLRLANLGEHQRAVGFPPGHPAMRTFLGVPLVIRGEVFGNLYLTEKEDGAQFTEEDERTVVTLAAAAAAAIENARLFERTRRREQWQQAVTRMGSVVLSGGTARDAAQVLAESACTLLKARSASVVLRDGLDGQGYQAASVADQAAEPVVPPGPLSAVPTFIAEAFLSAGAHGAATPDALPRAVVSLRARDRIVGVLVMQRLDTEAPFAEADLELAQPFFEQAALTLVLAETQREHERLAVFEDRDRIARDLHDLVIQRLFATGMLLQGAVRSMEQSPAVERIGAAIDQLDVTVKEIRQTIFALQEPIDGPALALRGRIMQEVSQATPVLGLTPTVRFTGTVDSSTSAEISDQAVAAVRELLTNIGKHAHATRVEVAVGLVDHQLIITVTDDGVGMQPGVRSSGLANLQARAVELGGGFEITTGEHSSGTTARWYVPASTEGSDLALG